MFVSVTVQADAAFRYLSFKPCAEIVEIIADLSVYKHFSKVRNEFLALNVVINVFYRDVHERFDNFLESAVYAVYAVRIRNFGINALHYVVIRFFDKLTYLVILNSVEEKLRLSNQHDRT